MFYFYLSVYLRIFRNMMNLNYIQFRGQLFSQGLFNIAAVRLLFPGFNTDNLLNWQTKGYIVKLRNGWYCFREFLSVPDHHFIIANSIYEPSYISHQEALAYYGLIPEYVVDSVSISTKKTNNFIVNGRNYKYYSLKSKYYFGYCLKDLSVNGLKRSFVIAEPEKAILDFLYIFDFYKTELDFEDLRLNETILRNEINWKKMSDYTARFEIATLEKKIATIKKVYEL